MLWVFFKLWCRCTKPEESEGFHFFRNHCLCPTAAIRSEFNGFQILWNHRVCPTRCEDGRVRKKMLQKYWIVFFYLIWQARSFYTSGWYLPLWIYATLTSVKYPAEVQWEKKGSWMGFIQQTQQGWTVACKAKSYRFESDPPVFGTLTAIMKKRDS